MNPKFTTQKLFWSGLITLLAAGCVPDASEADLPLTDESTSQALTQLDSTGVTIKQIFAGDQSTFALKSDGTVWAWGRNVDGKLGLGDKVDRTTPTQITTLSGVSHFSTGSDHACAIATGGVLWCWGDNTWAQLGIGDYVDRLTPTKVPGLTKLSDVVLGGTYSCVKKTDKTLWCWGGDGTFSRWGYSTATPVQYGGADVAQAMVGWQHACLVKTDGSLWCWGSNDNGQLGNITAPRGSFTPIPISGVTDIKVLAINYWESMILQKSGTLWGWGQNGSGQLGVGVLGDRLTPTQVTGTDKFLQVSMGYSHGCATRSGGKLWCWGQNTHGELGLGFKSYTPYLAPVDIGLSGVSQIAADEDSTCVLKTDGTVWCWGGNSVGQLGIGDKTDRYVPTQVVF